MDAVFVVGLVFSGINTLAILTITLKAGQWMGRVEKHMETAEVEIRQLRTRAYQFASLLNATLGQRDLDGRISDELREALEVFRDRRSTG